MSYTKIQPRGGTKYEWTTMNPVLAERELAVEYPDSGIGTGLCRFKFGDGFRKYTELPYAFDGASASTMIGGSAFAGNLFQIRADSHENWLLANPILEENEMVYDKTFNCFYVGDGVSRFSQLTPAGKQLIYDFGEDGVDNFTSPVVPVTASTTAFSARLAPTSTLGDLMAEALSEIVDPQPIDEKPLIINKVSEEEADKKEEQEFLEEEEKTEPLSGEEENIEDDELK